MPKKVPNMKVAYIEASKAYFKALQSATAEQKASAEASDISVAEDLQGLMIDLNYSDMYEDGTLFKDINPVFEAEYRQWVKDWGLPEPTGKPNYDFDINDYIEQSK